MEREQAKGDRDIAQLLPGRGDGLWFAPGFFLPRQSTLKGRGKDLTDLSLVERPEAPLDPAHPGAVMPGGGLDLHPDHLPIRSHHLHGQFLATCAGKE